MTKPTVAPESDQSSDQDVLDQTMISLAPEAFEAVLRWMEAEPTDAELAGMERLRAVRRKWADG